MDNIIRFRRLCFNQYHFEAQVDKFINRYKDDTNKEMSVTVASLKLYKKFMNERNTLPVNDFVGLCVETELFKDECRIEEIAPRYIKIKVGTTPISTHTYETGKEKYDNIFTRGIFSFEDKKVRQLFIETYERFVNSERHCYEIAY